jgi:hypothetical protein
MTPPTTDTSREAVEAHLNDVEVDATEASFRTVVLLRAVCAERDEWRAAFGHFLSEIPLQDVLGASGSVQDAIDYFKTAIAERDALRDQLAADRDAVLEEVFNHFEPDELDGESTREHCEYAQREIRALKSTTPATGEVTVQEAYLAGFMAAGEGYNGEYPFQDNNASPEGCNMWVKQRDEDLRALAQEKGDA